MRIMKKITHLMRGEPQPPRGLWSLGIWLGRKLEPEDLEELSELEACIGETEANRCMVTALVESDRYQSTDGETIELL